MDSITYRTADSGDAENLAALADSAQISHWGIDAYLKEIGNQGSIVEVAIFNRSTMVGFIHTRLLSDDSSSFHTESTVSELEILTIAVDKSYRRHSIGRKLFNRVITDCDSYLPLKIFLEVRESNNSARLFYESMGFHKTGKRKNYYTRPTGDALLMEMRLR